ncbi:permease [Pseudoroseomonas deserti]|uniref:Probable membrane transporter protein n=1 Tax=Teichococcus deserti TaxID=1817963 RepID=A0A1V2GZL4_9PROT|nr:sulfite exporter TauE/SafE family protein [Pseudoroseomonas deserti]ONG51074.1 permease [Pseudoroseomonas deserti]
MDGSTILSIVLGAAMAGFVQGLSGFAFGLVAMSVWAWTLEPQLAAMLALSGALTGQVVAAITVRRGFDLRQLAPFVIGGLAGLPLGVLILPLLDIQLFRALLGTLLVVWCPFMLLAPSLPPVTVGGPVANGVANGVAGLAGGFLSGLGGFSGVIPTLWCTLRRMNKDTQRSVIQNFNLAMLSCALAVHAASGSITRAMLPQIGIAAAAMLIPSLIGARLYIGISEASFRKIVLGLLTASGVALLASSVPGLLRQAG